MTSYAYEQYFSTSPRLWSACDTVNNVIAVIAEETEMPQGSILQKIVQWQSTCWGLAPRCPGSCHRCDKVKHNPTRTLLFSTADLSWLDTHESQKTLRQSNRYLHKGLIIPVKSYLGRNTLAFLEDGRTIFHPTDLSNCAGILISVKISEKPVFTLQKEQRMKRFRGCCRWSACCAQGMMRLRASLHFGYWHPALDFDSALSNSTNVT